MNNFFLKKDVHIGNRFSMWNWELALSWLLHAGVTFSVVLCQPFYKYNLTEFKSQLSISHLLLQEENNFERVVICRSNGIPLLEQWQTIDTVLMSPDVWEESRILIIKRKRQRVFQPIQIMNVGIKLHKKAQNDFSLLWK